MSKHSWFTRALLAWYDQGHRDLPWRGTRSPYGIWLSEVILQQTRVEQGLPYYRRFVSRYPTVKALAAASEDDVLKLWQGLGYYSRARNLLAAARQVAGTFNGRFPRTHAGLLQLKGVGDYTAAAIASIAFDECVPVVDGNVFRVLSRVFGIKSPIDAPRGKMEFRDLAARLVDPSRPGDHNQAVMELGALVCRPRNPDCGACPLAFRCIARKEQLTGMLPVKSRRTFIRQRHFNYLWIEDRGGVRFTRRESGDIWQGLYELPLVETRSAANAGHLRKALGHDGVARLSGAVDHVLSHQRIRAVLWKVDPGGASMPAKWRKVRRSRMGELATHRLMEKLLEGMR